MKTEDLIQNLTAELKPVKAMLSPLRMTALFSMIGFALIALSLVIVSARGDLKEQVLSAAFLFEVGVSLLLALSALALSVFLSRPGRAGATQNLEKATLGFLALALIYNIARVLQLSQSQISSGLDLSGFECFISVIGYATLLGGAMMFWLRRGASENPKLSGLVIGLGAVSLGNVSISLFCGIDNGMHSLLWHLALPMIAALAAGVLASRSLLKW